jgi:hypothetical protein
MHDYEIRDVMRRSTVPNLKLDLSIGPTNPRQLRYTTGQGRSEPIPLIFTISNTSLQPATHAIVTIGVDNRFIITSTGDYEGPLPKQADDLTHFRLLIRPPSWMPIFREAPPEVLSNREFHIAISAQPSIPKEFLITGLIHSPGLVHSQTWHLIDEDKWAQLVEIN